MVFIRAISESHLPAASAPHFLSTSCDLLDFGAINTDSIYPLLFVECLADLANPHGALSPLSLLLFLKKQREAPVGSAGFRTRLCSIWLFFFLVLPLCKF